MKTKILCVVPVYNEEIRLFNLIGKVKKSKKKNKKYKFFIY